MSKAAISAALLVFASALNASAATYYVDQSAGNDANNGSVSSPWKNSPGMSAYSGSGRLAAGDTVYFDKGDTWLVSGSQGLLIVGGVTYIGDSWGNGTRATIKASASLDAGVIRFQDHPTVPTIFKGFDVDANHTVSTGIDINHRFWQLMNGATKRVENSIVHNVSSSQSAGQYKYGIIISNFGGTAGYAENVELINNVVHDTSRDGICLYPGDNDANDRIRNITVRGNEAYNTGQDSGYCCGAGFLIKGFVQDAFVENNYAHDNKGAAVFVNSNETNHFGNGPTNVHIRYNILTNNTNNGIIRIYDGSSPGDPKDLKIYGNLVFNNTITGGLYLGSDLLNTLSLSVYNNTFYNAPVFVLNSSASITKLDFRNNIVYYTGGTPITGSNRFTQFSNNVTTNPSFKNAASLPTGFTGTFGSDIRPNSDGLSVVSGSPAIDAGVAIGSPYQGSINSLPRPQGGNWDIGAYEFGAQGSAPPSAPTNLKVIIP